MSSDGRTVFMSGGSRGIGLAIAERMAAEGARIAFVAKSDKPHPTLPGTIHTAAESIQRAGGEALAIVGDIRFEDQVEAAVAQAVERFGAIDICMTMLTLGLAADAAFEILRHGPSFRSGRAMIDDEVLAEAGVTDLGVHHPAGRVTDLELDFFIDGLPAATAVTA